MRSFFTLIIIVLLVAGGGYYWLTKQQALPDWYVEGKKTEAVMPEVAVEDRLEDVQEQFRTSEKVEISEADISHMLREKLTAQYGESSKELVKGMKSTIKPEKMSLEMVVDADKIPWSDLPETYRFAKPFVEQLASLSDGDLLISASGRPQMSENGQLQFDHQSKIRVGVLEYSLKDILDMTQSKKQRQMLDMLNNLPFSDVTLGNGVLVFER